MASTSEKVYCPECGNALFHCGLTGWPHWCGACNWRGLVSEARKAEEVQA